MTKKTAQMVYLACILSLALILACVDAFATPQEDAMLLEEAKEAQLYWGLTYSKMPFPIHMVDRIANPPDAYAGCWRQGGRSVELVVVRHTWNEMDASSKRMVMVHELGHCLMGLGHDSRPDQIMSAQVDTSPESKLLRLLLLSQQYNRSWKLEERK